MGTLVFSNGRKGKRLPHTTQNERHNKPNTPSFEHNYPTAYMSSVCFQPSNWWNPLKPLSWQPQKQEKLKFRKRNKDRVRTMSPEFVHAQLNIFKRPVFRYVKLCRWASIFTTFQKHYDLSKYWELLLQRQSVTFHKISVFTNIAVRSLNHTYCFLKIPVLWDVTPCQLVKLPTFQKYLVPSSQGTNGTLLGLLDPKYGDTSLHWNGGNHLPVSRRNIPEGLNLILFTFTIKVKTQNHNLKVSEVIQNAESCGERSFIYKEGRISCDAPLSK